MCGACLGEEVYFWCGLGVTIYQSPLPPFVATHQKKKRKKKRKANKPTSLGFAKVDTTFQEDERTFTPHAKKK